MGLKNVILGFIKEGEELLDGDVERPLSYRSKQLCNITCTCSFIIDKIK